MSDLDDVFDMVFEDADIERNVGVEDIQTPQTSTPPQPAPEDEGVPIITMDNYEEIMETYALPLVAQTLIKTIKTSIDGKLKKECCSILMELSGFREKLRKMEESPSAQNGVDPFLILNSLSGLDGLQKLMDENGINFQGDEDE